MRASKLTSRPGCATLHALPTRRAVDVDHDVVAHLRKLLDDALAGDVTGLAYVATRPHSRLTLNACGELRRDLLLGRGAVAVLGDEMGRLLTE